MKLSAVDQAVLARGFAAATQEMGLKLIRCAHSPIVREAQDCSAAILDSNGNVVAQAELTPIQLGSIGHTFSPCLAAYPAETLTEDDFFMNNDPYHGGQHLPDIFLFTPIFYDGSLVGFAASVVHHIDLGGGAPGLNVEAGDIHQEGLIFPPAKYSFSRDWNGGPLERFIAANVRLPDATIGDLNAQFAANAIGNKRVTKFCDKYGTDGVEEAMNAVLDYSERRARSAIERLPDGTYHGEAQLDDNGITDEPVTIKVAVTLDGDSISVDFAGTDPQAASNINCPFASTYAAAMACIKSVLTSSDIPYNDGLSRLVHLSAPVGSLVNPIHPAPVRARLLASYRVFNAVMMALKGVVPELVIAEGFDTTSAVCLTHSGDQGFKIYLEVLGGGNGGGAANDGCDGVDSPLSNCANIPIESLDMDYEFFRLEEYCLLPGSGGEGKFRGGLGFRRSYRVLQDGVRFATYGDRFTIAAKGILGGEDGTLAQTYVERNGQRITLGSKTAFDLLAGDLLVVQTGGGGGYGPAEERLQERTTHDLTEGLVTTHTNSRSV